MPLPPDALRQLRIVAFGLVLGPTLFLGVGLILRGIGSSLGDVPVITYVAAAYALASPLLASILRQQILTVDGGGEPPVEKVRQAVIVPFAVLESAAFLCGVAFLLGATYWPLVAAAVPLATMLAWFPRGE